MYDYQTLTLTNIDGSISPFSNGASGLILLGTGTNTPPTWISLADAGIATLTDLAGYLPLTGGTLTGSLTGTTAAFTGLTLTDAGTGFVKASSGELSVGNIAVSDITSGWPTSNNGTGLYITGAANTSETAPRTLVNPSQDGLYVLSFACYGDYGVDNPLTNTTHIGWEKLSPGVVISNEGSTHSKSLITVSTATEGQVLAKTSSGYGFIDVGASIVPPITSLQIGSSGLTNAYQFLSKNGTNVTSDTNPIWSVLTAAHIYVNANAAASTGPSVLVNDSGEATAKWLGCDNTGGTGPLFIGVLPGYDVSALQLSDYALSANTELKDVATGLNASSIVGVDSNGNLVNTSLNAYRLVAGGTTSTPNTIQQLADATSNYVLVGNGASALPTWQEKAPKASVADSATTATTAGSANTLTTLRTLTIGNTGKTFDGSANVSWTQNEIGFARGKSESYTVNSIGWWRIATLNLGGGHNYAHFYFRGQANNSVCGDFEISVNQGYSPKIKNNLYSSTASINVITNVRLVYKTGSSAYLEVYVNQISTSQNSMSFVVEMNEYNNINLYSSENITQGSIPEGYHYLKYDFKNNTFGGNNQFLKTVSTTDDNDSSSKSIYYEWVTLPDIPSAPSSLPLVDNETGALGTAGTYANADHQHPLPYSVQAAYKFFYPRKIGIGGAVTAEAQEYDGTADLILQVTEIDPHAIINTVPIEKGGTGATTATQALTNLGAAAANHNHDSTYLKLSGGTMTGGITFADSVQVPFYWLGTGHTGVAVFGAGEMRLSDDVSNFVTGNTEFKSYYDDSFSQGSGGGYLERVTLAHTNGKNTVYNLAVGDQEPSGAAFTRNIKLPAPSADNLGDELKIIFTNKNSAAIGTINCNCETNSRLVKYDYSIASSLSWGSGNIVKFVCFQAEKNGTTYYWRAVKLVEQSW